MGATLMRGYAYLSDLNLDGGVVLGGNEPVGGRALAGNVKVNNDTLVVLHGFEK